MTKAVVKNIYFTKGEYDALMEHKAFLEDHFGYTHTLTYIIRDLVDKALDTPLSEFKAYSEGIKHDLRQLRQTSRRVGVLFDKEYCEEFEQMSKTVLKGKTMSQIIRTFILLGFEKEKEEWGLK